MKDSPTITQAVVLLAGAGTRVMPLTLSEPKGLLAVADEPALYYILRDLISSGITHIILVISPHQTQFKTYITYLESNVEFQKRNIRFDFALQKKLTGSADAVLTAKKFLKDGGFLVYSCDYLLAGKESAALTMMKIHATTRTPVIPLEKLERKELYKNATVGLKKEKRGLFKIHKIIEKPKEEEIISNWNVMPLYLLTQEILPYLTRASKGPRRRSEVAVAEALNLALEEGMSIFGWNYEGIRFDTGTKLGLMQANAYFAARHPATGKEFKKFLKKLY